MSRAFMPWYVGDYLRDTGHLTTEQHGGYLLLLGHCWQHGAIPLDDKERAAIAKLTLKRWRAIKAPVERFFNADGTQKRVTKELAKAEGVSVRRRIAGAKGGFHSAVAKAKQTASKPPGKMPANAAANGEQNSSNRSHNHNHNSLLSYSSESEAVRASAAQASEKPALPVSEPARTQPEIALERGCDPVREAIQQKPPSECSRADFEAMFDARRETKP